MLKQELKHSKSFASSQKLYKQALKLMPGGVNSPVRAFKSINSEPLFIKKAQGAYVWDADDNQYIDFVGSWGPMIHGHNDTDIKQAIQKTLEHGTSFGAPTELENLMAAEVVKLVPSIEKVRFVNSGTEAVMSALRLARAYAAKINSNKTKIVKFTGCYHGHVDQLLVQAGSGVATLGLPDSPGVSKLTTADTVLIPYNDPEELQKIFERFAGEIAAVILEPVIGNSGCIKPQAGFLELLRELTQENGTLLIFDEVMTGFRVARGGAQELYGIKPDITCLGKIIGGGLPVGAYGASQEIMSMIAPEGPVYQAGTLSGNPLAMSAGLACLKKLQAENFYQELEAKAKYLSEGMQAAVAVSSKIAAMQVTYVGAMFGFFFAEQEIKSYEDAKANLNAEVFRDFYLAMLERGVYFAPSMYEAGFVSAAHSYEDLDKVIEAFKNYLSS